MKARIAGFAFGVALVCAIAWLGGFDFDHRGTAALAVALLSACIGLIFACVAGEGLE